MARCRSLTSIEATKNDIVAETEADKIKQARGVNLVPEPMRFTDLPLDVLQPILADLSDRKHWHTCALVNKAFNQVATPLLYRTLDSRIKQSKLYHPSATLINRPELAKYVWKIKETGAVHFANRPLQPNITHETLQALTLCTDLHSLVWTDDSPSASFVAFHIPFSSNENNSTLSPWSTNALPGSSILHGTTSERDQTFFHPLLCFLTVIREIKAPLRELTIRSHSDLGPEVWSELSKWKALCKISIWCMEGPPKVLQGWAGQELGKTLTELELGRCAGVPPTILVSVISQLPLLQNLYLKGAPPSAVLTIFTLLPRLHTLDTEFLNPGAGNIWPRGWPLQLRTANSTTTTTTNHDSDASQNLPVLPTLRNLTVRTSSIDTLGPNKLFPWIRALVVNPGLESLRLLTFTTSGYTDIPRSFILDMARVHGDISPSLDSVLPGQTQPTRSENTFKGLRKWIVGQAQMTLSDIECVCKTFPELEELACSVAVVMGDMESIVDAISSATNLHTLRLHVQWIPPDLPQQQHHHSWLPSDEIRLLNGNSWAFDRALTPSPELTESESDLDSDYVSDNDGVGGSAHHDASLDGTSGPPPRAAVSSRLMAAYGFNPNFNANQSGSSEMNARRDNLWHRNGNGNGNGNWNGRNGGKIIADGGGGGGGGIEQQQYHRSFTLEHARTVMDREGSKLRVMVVTGVVYTGRWIWDNENAEAKFEVECAGEEE